MIYFNQIIILNLITLVCCKKISEKFAKNAINRNPLDIEKVYPSSYDPNTVTNYLYVKWTEENGFDIKQSDVELYENDWAAKARFQNTINETGWTTLEVETDPKYPDTVQARAAGIAEGLLTKDLIYLFYLNMIEGYCLRPGRHCKEIFEFIEQNRNWSNKKISKKSSDPYFHQLHLVREQFNGIMDGINWFEKDGIFNENDLMLINILQDVGDVNTAIQWRKDKTKLNFWDWDERCSLLVKIIGQNEDLYTGHNTWTDPRSMLRILKRYNFAFHETSQIDSPIVPARSISMSSYPGMIYSMDDFFTTSTGLVVSETTIRGFDPEIWNHVQPENGLFTFEKVMIVNRLAHNGSHWAQLYQPYNLGTYNNQWIVVDYNRFKPGGKQLQDGLLHIVEQMPGIIIARDQTEVLREKGYFASYNVPYFPEIQKVTNVSMMIEKFGDIFFSYNNSARARIFRRDQDKVVDMESMIKLMRYNDYTNDPLSKCDICEEVPYSAALSISSRTDLNPRNVSWPFPHIGYLLGPALDLKVTSVNLIKSENFLAIGGPTFDPLPPFEWKTAPDDISFPHWGMPEKFNFTPVITQWLWK